MRRTIQFLFIAILLTSAGSIYAQKLGHFNSNDLMKRMPEADSIQNVLKTYIASLETDFRTMKEEYDRNVADYQAKKDQLSDLIKSTKEKELMRASENLNETYQSLQDSIQQKNNELMTALIDKVKAVVAEVAKEGKYTYIFEGNSVLWYAEESEDITPKLVKKLNLK
jgi:outer membrane protein